MGIKTLMKVLLTILMLWMSSCFLRAQSHDLIVDDEDVAFRITALADGGVSGNGNAFIDLLRNSDPASAAIRWNLNNAPSPGVFSLTSERWLLGIDGDDDFRLTRRSIDLFDLIEADAFVISDDQDGDGRYTDPVISFPAGYIDIGADISFSTESEGELQISGGDLVPSGLCTGQDIGNSSPFERWDNVVADDFVEYDCVILEAPAKSLKSNYNGLNKILSLNTYKSEMKSNSDSKMFLHPNELIQIIPEAVHTQDIDIDQDGNQIIKPIKNYGVKYNQLIPVLIDAIQEQNELIQKLESRLSQLEKD